MPSSVCDLGPTLSEYADDMFLECALNVSCNLEPLGPLMLRAIPPLPLQSLGNPTSEDSFYPADNTPVLSNEIWKKFDLPDDETSTDWPYIDENSWDLNSILPTTSVGGNDSGNFQSCTGKELRHHDCMWTGECKNKEHVRSKSIGEQRVVAPGQTLLKNPVQKDSTVPSSVMMKSPSPMLTASPTVIRVPQRGGVVTRTPTGKSVLLKTSRTGGKEAVSARVVTLRLPEEKERGGKKFGGSSPRPETPLSLSEEEDEESLNPEDVEEAEAAAAFQEALLHLAAEEKEDEDECGKAVSMAEVSGQVRMSNQESRHLDHDYHMSGSKAVKTDHLGVQTPSDSEEEIDVVGWNGGDKGAAARPAATRSNSKAVPVNLPTNPSARERNQLEAAIASFVKEEEEEYAESEESEEEEEEEEEEDYDYESSEGARGGGKSVKRQACGDDSGPAPKQSRLHHKRRRKSPRDDDPDYEGHAIPSWSTSNSYLSSSSSGTSSPPRRRGGHRKRSHRHHHEAGDSAPEDPLERRSMHNTMERQRRIDLRNAFESLRLLVPAVCEKERAAKVTILREAAVYCTHLGTQETKQVDTLRALRERQVALRAKVSSLRRSLAASR